jgi:DNA-binding MarR family transcriptional regulator
MDEPGLSVSELARPFSLRLAGMTKHLDVLSDAGLIARAKTGRTRLGLPLGRADARGDGVAQTI